MNSEYEAPSVEPLSPGTALKKARKALGLTVEEIAGELRLSATQIRALESDDYSDLPGVTYVRGYLRSYARLVQVDEQSVLPPLQPEPAAKPMPAVARSVQRQARSSDRWVRLISYSLGISLIVLVILWWRSQGGLDFDQDLFADRTRTEIRDSAAVKYPDLGLSKGASAAPSESVVRTPAASATEPDAVVERQSDSFGSERNPVAAGAQIPQPPGGDAAARGADALVASAAARHSGKIKLLFSDASWVEIRDAENKRLVHESFNPGRVLEVEGTAPFKVFLGNAAGVSMEINGKSFDITPYQTGLYARFIVDTQEDN